MARGQPHSPPPSPFTPRHFNGSKTSSLLNSRMVVAIECFLSRARERALAFLPICHCITKAAPDNVYTVSLGLAAWPCSLSGAMPRPPE